jgi:hypothetical protein
VRADELDLFLSGKLSGGARAEIETHLSACRECRRRLVAQYQESKAEVGLVQAPRWLKRRAFAIPRKGRAASPAWVLGLGRPYSVAVAALVVAVAGGLAVFLYTTDATRRQAPPDVLRQDNRPITTPQLLAPSADAVIASNQIEFRWSRVEGARGYRLTLMNEKGDILFQSSSEQEHLVLKAMDARLERGKPYFWYVTAESPLATTLDSGMGKFTLAE